MIIFEIILGAFAGYCCCYFLTMKLMRLTPEQLLEEYIEIILNKIRR